MCSKQGKEPKDWSNDEGRIVAIDERVGAPAALGAVPGLHLLVIKSSLKKQRWWTCSRIMHSPHPPSMMTWWLGPRSTNGEAVTHCYRWGTGCLFSNKVVADWHYHLQRATPTWLRNDEVCVARVSVVNIISLVDQRRHPSQRRHLRSSISATSIPHTLLPGWHPCFSAHKCSVASHHNLPVTLDLLSLCHSLTALKEITPLTCLRGSSFLYHLSFFYFILLQDSVCFNRRATPQF